MKIKLSKTFKEKYLKASQDAQATAEQYNTFSQHLKSLETQKNNAMSHLKDIVEIIAEVNKVDVSEAFNGKIGHTFQIDNEDNLVIEAEKTHSETVREKLKVKK